jgi:hypothetical protein
MDWNYVDPLIDSQAILSLRDIEENGMGRHEHRCANCLSSFWCDEELCSIPSVTRCKKATCRDRRRLGQ